MVEATGLIGEQQALEDLERVLMTLIRPGDDAVRVVVSALASTSAGEVRAITPSGAHESPQGRWDSLRMPAAAILALKKLRAASYRDQVGTWFSAEITTTSSGRTTARYNYDDEPTWKAPVDPVAYADDLEKFPRALEHQPAWLRERLAEASAAAE